jgi:energy-coupling factor transporter ATP-binding protein EcfA2
MTELSNRPLIATARDQQLSVVRGELPRLIELARRGLNVLLVGDRGSGKTSALHSLAFALREQGRRAELVDAASASGVLELVQLIDRAVSAPATAPDQPISSAQLLEALGRSPAAGRSETSLVLETLRSWRGLEHEVCVLLDEVRPGLAHPLFGRLRDELWQTPLRFVVAAPARDLASFLAPPADAFFEATVRLEPLSAEEQESLLRRRLDEPDAARVLRALQGADLGNPRELLGTAREALISGTGEGDVEAARRERTRRVAALGPAAERLLGELDALGSASASDPRLLERLGWSRQRAAQVARALEAADLVASETTRGEDGRVRRVFMPVPPLRLTR